MDKLIYKTKHFSLKVPSLPHIPREDGGHIFIESNDPNCSERTQFSEEQAVECAWFTMISGQAMTEVLRSKGIDIYRINYQDNGNWSFLLNKIPLFHIHLYGRATTEKNQKYGNALYLPFRDTGFYDDFSPLSDEDIEDIRSRISELSKTTKYSWASCKTTEY